MSKEYENTDIAGYRVDGTPITSDDLKNRVSDASLRVKSGDYLTQEDVEKEIKDL